MAADDTGCPVGILIDLSEPVSSKPVSQKFDEDIKHKVPSPWKESIEITRKESTTVSKPIDFDDHFKEDVKGKILTSQLSDSDVPLIEDEVFDFDLPSSPENDSEFVSRCKGIKDDDGEVFTGPMGFTEKCIAAGVAEETIQPVRPLRPDEIAEIAREAYGVAHRIASMKMRDYRDECSSPEPVKTTFLRRKTGSLFQHIEADSSHSSQRVTIPEKKDLKENTENISPRKRKRSNTFTKESPETEIPGSSEKKPKRKGLYTTEVPVENLISSRITRSGAKDGKVIAGNKVKKEDSNLPASKRLLSYLRRYNTSQPDLMKPKPQDPEPMSKNKQPITSVPASATGTSRRSLQLPRPSGGGANTERQQQGSNPSVLSSQQQTAKPAQGIRRAHSFNLKTGLPTASGSKLDMNSQKVAAPSTNSNRVSSKNGVEPVAGKTLRRSSGLPKAPPKMLQQVNPKQMPQAPEHKRTAGTPKSRTKAASSTTSKMGETVERPYNPALAAAAGNYQCPDTPASQRFLRPKILSMNSEPCTPVKSSCSSSSVCESTPGSVNKRSSLLPTPSKRRSSSKIPQSPIPVRSSKVSKYSSASSSDAFESPVVEPKAAGKMASTRRRSGLKESFSSSDLNGSRSSPFAFKPCKPLVQNTPDLPKRTASGWSPLRRPKPASLEDQVSMCTKRITTK